MFVVSMKASKKKVLLFFLLCVALVTGLILLIGIGKTSEVSKRGGTVASAKTNEERISYLKTFGWNVEEEACEIVEVAIPSEFDDVYQQ